jgi:hypothetical protein
MILFLINLYDSFHIWFWVRTFTGGFGLISNWHQKKDY